MISMMIPVWINQTPRLITLKRMRRRVVTMSVIAISAIRTSKGHQWNHSNSVISKIRHWRSCSYFHPEAEKMFGWIG